MVHLSGWRREVCTVKAQLVGIMLHIFRYISGTLMDGFVFFSLPGKGLNVKKCVVGHFSFYSLHRPAICTNHSWSKCCRYGHVFTAPIPRRYLLTTREVSAAGAAMLKLMTPNIDSIVYCHVVINGVVRKILEGGLKSQVEMWRPVKML